MSDPVLAKGRVAVVTGAASGIGLAACKRFAALGMRVAMADNDADELRAAEAAVTGQAAGGGGDVLAVATDVAKPADLERLRDATYDRFGETALLMNNAAARVAGGSREDLDEWRHTMEVNFWGVVCGVRVFLPGMIEQGTPARIVNTGSKQGITNPPGNLIYNVSKSAVKTYTEGLQHELRNTDGCQVTAHLLIPGWTTTGKREHKPGAWLPDQVVERMEAALGRGDFYILCPDNEVTSEMDRKRILWGAGDITENRPPLSRWHVDWAEAFKKG
ncbi:MAG: SDR family NAD(P)-dependent oxidoreductase [Inquilinus sp.]|nr:SDR family NAD(P)-dependent oxidoreductase [Inquilinus sp.]